MIFLTRKFPSKVYGVGALHIDSVSDPKQAKQLAFSLRVSSADFSKRAKR
jgi:hypothetical protein